ncbi:hypothetical protein [Duganella radicis]|uniref:Uncharacterized protein n=1 Tax=Duganella radicis TaxID=551988 RepID=A0A6L6PH48_9BURK|nr:hypothetical protein [Duganella radicis]MTV38378.1 hypothetical protein [Duganella radicis]
MSSEDRLKRLGLWHLKDDPEALKAAIDKKLKESEALEKGAQDKHLKQLQSLLKDQMNAADIAPPPENPGAAPKR